MRTLCGICLTVALAAGVASGATNGSNGLAEAAKNQQKASIQSLLKQKADVNARDMEGMTALIWAAHWNDADMVQMLLKAGADASLKSNFDDSALYEACLNGNSAIVEALLKARADPNSFRGEGETALMTASRTGDLGSVKALLAHKADVNAVEKWRGETALMWAAAENHPDVVRELLAAGADVNYKTKLWEWPKMKARAADLPVTLPDGGFTALLFAARQGSLESAKLLVNAKADLSYKEPQGYTPLLLAVYNGHYDLAKMLVEGGAKVDDGSLWMAAEARNMDKSDKHPAPTDYGQVRSLEMMRVLLDHKAPVDGETKVKLPLRAIMEGGGPAVGSPLYRAARSSDLEGMKLLLDHGANPKYTTGNLTTVLMSVAGSGFNMETGTWKGQDAAIEAAKIMLDHGVDINAANDQGMTAMHYAAMTGREKLIEFLHERGGRVDLLDKRGRSPYIVATGVGNGGNREGVPEPEAMAVLQKLMAEQKAKKSE
jgi:ankyrin repeat protein